MATDLLAHRVAALEAAFALIARTRMAGVPVLHPGLHVKAVGFVRQGDVALGMLVTPWFMNLLRLPLDAGAQVAAVGVAATRDCGPQRLAFIGADEAQFGRYEACSLFSPMFEFADQAAAVATAREVLAQLQPTTPDLPARRGFLFGRTAAAAP